MDALQVEQQRIPHSTPAIDRPEARAAGVAGRRVVWDVSRVLPRNGASPVELELHAGSQGDSLDETTAVTLSKLETGPGASGRLVAMDRATNLLPRSSSPEETPLRTGEPAGVQYSSTSAALEAMQLPRLMELSVGSPEISIAMIDGPIVTNHPLLAASAIRVIGESWAGIPNSPNDAALSHGTFVAGMLTGPALSPAPAICRDCTLLVRPIFRDSDERQQSGLRATPDDLAQAILDVVAAGAQVVNLSIDAVRLSKSGTRMLEGALDLAMKNDVLVVAAAGNQATPGGASIARHPWVIPVVACDRIGRPIESTNLGASMGRRGVCAVGDAITSLSPEGGLLTMGGTSVATPFVSGTIALLRSIHPAAPAADVRLAITRGSGRARRSIVPPVLNAWAAHQQLSAWT